MMTEQFRSFQTFAGGVRGIPGPTMAAEERTTVGHCDDKDLFPSGVSVGLPGSRYTLDSLFVFRSPFWPPPLYYWKPKDGAADA